MTEDRDAMLAHAQHQLDCARDRLRFTHEFAAGAMKSVTLINGGALIALFTLVGHFAGQGANRLAISGAELRSSLTWFCVGLGSALVSQVLAYISQDCLSAWSTLVARSSVKELLGREEKPPQIVLFIGAGTALAASIAVLCSLASFIFGSIEALSAVSIP